jgi:hypothetical protein
MIFPVYLLPFYCFRVPRMSEVWAHICGQLRAIRQDLPTSLSFVFAVSPFLHVFPVFTSVPSPLKTLWTVSSVSLLSTFTRHYNSTLSVPALFRTSAFIYGTFPSHFEARDAPVSWGVHKSQGRQFPSPRDLCDLQLTSSSLPPSDPGADSASDRYKYQEWRMSSSGI